MRTDGRTGPAPGQVQSPVNAGRALSLALCDQFPDLLVRKSELPPGYFDPHKQKNWFPVLITQETS